MTTEALKTIELSDERLSDLHEKIVTFRHRGFGNQTQSQIKQSMEYFIKATHYSISDVCDEAKFVFASVYAKLIDGFKDLADVLSEGNISGEGFYRKLSELLDVIDDIRLIYKKVIDHSKSSEE
jgi:hypothetical protein